MNTVEEATVEKLQGLGFDFKGYLNPISYLPETLVGPYSDELEEEE